MPFFALRINKIKIKDNRDCFDAEIKILSFFSIGDNSLGDLDGIESMSLAKKETAIKSAIKNILSMKEFIVVDHIKDGQSMTFGDCGYAVFTANIIPESFNWTILVIDSDSSERKLSKLLDDVVKSDEASNLVSQILELTSFSSGQLWWKIVKGLSGIVAKFLKSNNDDQVGVFYISCNKYEHYPRGEKKADDVVDVSGNAYLDYSIYAHTDSV